LYCCIVKLFDCFTAGFHIGVRNDIKPVTDETGSSGKR